MAWWKDADKRKVPSPAEVRERLGFAPEPSRPPRPKVKVLGAMSPAAVATLLAEVLREGTIPDANESQCVGIAHDCRCVDCDSMGRGKA